MFYLIGIGLYSEKDLSIKAIEIIKTCDKAYAELYTADISFNPNNFQKLTRKQVQLLTREQVEQSNKFLEEAKTKNICLLVPGDPLFATTHLEILQRAKEKNIQFKIIHSSSIQTTVGETGLSLYNFGKIVSLPKPQKNFFPTSFYDTILQNKKQGLHTLLLLDIGLDINHAAKILEDIEKQKQKNKKLFTNNIKLFACAQLGSEMQMIKYCTLKEMKYRHLGKTPHCIVIPGKLTHYEEDFIKTLYE